jgi:hypothetical protein
LIRQSCHLNSQHGKPRLIVGPAYPSLNAVNARAKPEYRARQKDGDEQSIQSKSCDRGGHQNDECAGRTANLKSAAAERRDKKAADDGRIETAHRFDAGRHGNGHNLLSLSSPSGRRTAEQGPYGVFAL